MCAVRSNAYSVDAADSYAKRQIEKRQRDIALRGVILGTIDYCQGILDWLENEEEHDPLRNEAG